MTRMGAGGIALTGTDIEMAGSSGVKLQAMLYEPVASSIKSGPAVILCPGGIGTGMYEIFEWLAASLRDAGFVVLTMNWRSGSPECDPDDVAVATDWLLDCASVDPARIGIMGMSRGANAAIRSAAGDSRLAVLVTFGAVTDFIQQAKGTAVYAPGRHKMLVDWLGDPDTNRAFYERVQAITVADRVKQPVLMVHGQHDMHAPPEQSIWVKEAIERGGNTNVRLEIVPMMGHYGDVIPNGYGFDILRAIIVPFFRDYLSLDQQSFARSLKQPKTPLSA